MKTVILVVLAVVMAALLVDPVAAQVEYVDVPCDEQGGIVVATAPPVQAEVISGPAGRDGRDGRDGLMVVKVVGGGIGIDRNGRVRSVGTHKSAKPRALGVKRHRALWSELHQAGVLGKGEIEKRDRETLVAATDYTDQVVGAVSTRTWIAIGLSILAVIVAAFAWRRRSSWRPVCY